MFKRVETTGTLQKINDLAPGVMDIADPDFNNTGAEVETSFGRSQNIEITLHADEDNTGIIYVAEHASAGPDEYIWLKPGASIKFNRSQIKVKNIFHINGSAGDLLFFVVR